MYQIRRSIIILACLYSQGLQSAQMARSYDEVSQAFFNYSTSLNDVTLQKLQEAFKQADFATQQDIIAEVKASGFDPKKLKLELRPTNQPAHVDVAQELARLENSLEALSVATQIDKKQQAARAQMGIARDWVVLKARTQGEGTYLWDCTWEVLKNAQYLYTQLKSNKNIPQDISAAPYATWCPTSQEYEKLQMQSDAMEDVIQKNNLFEGNYAFIEGDVQHLSPDFILNMDGIKKVKQTPGAAFVFLVNPAGHWFTVVAHNVPGKVIYYIADDTPKSEATYKQVVDFLKTLVG